MYPKVLIYTDGACSNKLRVGGYCGVVTCNGQSIMVYDHHRHVTNNQMEMMAVIESLRVLNTPCDVTVVSDSQYTLGGIGKGWIYGWINRGWITSTGKPVQNRELWEEMFELCQFHNSVSWYWVKGHSDVLGNEVCDMVSRAYPSEIFKK